MIALSYRPDAGRDGCTKKTLVFWPVRSKTILAGSRINHVTQTPPIHLRALVAVHVKRTISTKRQRLKARPLGRAESVLLGHVLPTWSVSSHAPIFGSGLFANENERKLTIMQTTRKLLGIILFGATIVAFHLRAQNIGDQVDPPTFGGDFYSMAYPDYPPIPFYPPGLDIYYLGTNEFGFSGYAYDDRQGRNYSQNTVEPPPVPGGDSGGGDDPGPGPQPMVDYGTNLFIQIFGLTNQLADAGTQQVANLYLMNTVGGKVYEIISSANPSSPMSNWVSEGLWIAPGTNTPTPVPVWNRTNALCFRGKVWDGTFAHGVATNGQIYLLCQDTNAIQGVVNGFTNTITPIYSNWAVLQPPVWTANFGFSGDDLGPTNYISLFTNQNIHALLGFSRGMSNLALAFNPISQISVASWPKLTYLEMWHATNLVSVNVTNCPKLYRVCFESVDGSTLTNGIKDVLDFTGCTNLADLRAANNNVTNIILGPNGGSNIWHFCMRETRNRNPNPVIQGIPFKSLPSLRQLWVWADNSFVDNIILTVTNSPKLESVEAYGNYFQSARFDNQTNLYEVLLDHNSMTNLIVTGCSVITNVSAFDNYLPSSVIDSVLVTLDQLGITNGAVYLDSDSSGNNGIPSSSGLQAVTNLLAKGWLVAYNHPGSGTPQISNIAVTPGSNHATITWTTANVASDSTVYYGTTTSYGSNTNNPLPVTSHSMIVTGLITNTTYHFYVASIAGANLGVSGDYQFTTLGRAPNTNVIWFLSTSATVSMQAGVDSGATVTWYWAGGATNTGTSAATNFGSASVRSNFVIVDPADALKRFGVTCQGSPDTTIGEIGGLSNYTKLEGLYAYYTYLTNLSLAGCTNLNYAALVGTYPSTNTVNSWFIDLANAQASVSTIGSNGVMCSDSPRWFYCQSHLTNDTSLTARTVMTNKGWTIFFAPP
jgi:hypothetical protein